MALQYITLRIMLKEITDFKWLFLVVYIIWQYLVPHEITGIFNGIRYNIVTTLLMIIFVTGFGFSYKYHIKEDFSYSFYLYHMVVINAVVEFVGNKFVNKFETYQNILLFIMAFVVTSVFAIFSKRMIEDSVRKRLD